MESAHQKHLRTGRTSETGRAYSLTKCTAKSVCLTDDPDIALLVIDTFFWMDTNGRFNLGAFVIMPDHYHVVIRLKNGNDLAGIMKSMGSFVARKINLKTGTRGQIWQKGYYDRGIRKSEDISGVAEYIHNNPVRQQLVKKPEEWPYSSLNPKYFQRIQWHLFT